MRLAARLCAALICLLALTGCPKAPPSPLDPVAATTLLEQLNSQTGQVNSLKGVARLKVKNADQSRGSLQALLIERPGSLRADVLSPFGQPLLQVAVHEQTLTAYPIGKKTAYRGMASARNLYRFIQLPLAVEDLVALSLYDIPKVGSSVEAVEREDSHLVLWLAGTDDRKQALVFGAEKRLVETRYYQGELLLLEVRYSEFALEQVPFPRQIEFILPQENARAELNYRKMTLNPEVDRSRFRLKIPSNVFIQSLETLNGAS